MIAQDIIEKVSELSNIPAEELNPSIELYDSGIVSSLSLLALMEYLEEKYCIVIKPEELHEDNFKDIETLANFVETKIPN